MTPDTALQTWLITLLKANAALTALVGGSIYSDLIPQDVPLPAVRVSLYSGDDTNYQTGERALTRSIYEVVGVTQGDDLTAPVAIRDAIDSALQTSSVLSTSLSAKISRVKPVQRPLIEVGERYNIYGGRYKVIFYGQSS